MDVKNIIQKIEDKKRYFPEEVDSTSVQSETGTVIILRDRIRRIFS
jgi:hypothetical protein